MARPPLNTAPAPAEARLVRRRAFVSGGLAALGLGIAGGSARAQAQAPAFRLLVHPDHPEASTTRKFLVLAFLKKTTFWETGQIIRPVDQAPESPVRRRFSDEVLERPVAAVRNYWQQLIFAGRAVPPPELDSDEAVIRYVLKNPGAVGYVSGTAELHGAKVLLVR
jgi:hypothetical protein